ncbi:MAG TPA: hypothetical protein VIL00_07155 [Pseudonocardiaceae bacterium]
MAGLFAENAAVPADWSAPERWLWEAYRRGEALDFSDNEDNDPARGDEWGAHRTVRGAVVEQILRHAPTPHPGHTACLYLIGARISGQLDLTNIRTEAPIVLTGCFFEQPVELSGAELNWVELTGSHLPGIDTTQTRFTRSLTLNRAVVTGPLRLLWDTYRGQPRTDRRPPDHRERQHRAPGRRHHRR